MKGLFLFFSCAVMTATSLYAQGVGINAANKPADASAMLDVSSTNQGMLVPRMTAAQRTGIASPATGLLVFQTDGSAGFYYNAGTPTTPNWLALHVMLAGSPVGTTDAQTLANKTLIDNSTYVADNVDNTKKMQFQVSGVTTGTTRTFAVPDANTTLVGTEVSQTLTNKTLIDSLTYIANGSDNTKRMQFQLSGVAAATTRTLTVPDENTTIVGTDVFQNLTHKHLTDKTNYVLSRGLWVNSGSADVSTYASPVPTSGQVLAATSPSTAAWQDPGVHYIAVSATNGVSTTSYPQVVIPGMSVKVPAGTYLVSFSALATVSSRGDAYWFGFYVNGVIEDGSLRAFTGNGQFNQWTQIYTQAVVTVSGASTIEAWWSCTASSGGSALPIGMDRRNLVLLKLE